MCLLIAAKPKNKVGNQKLKNAWASNNDGVGFAFVDNGKIITKKYMKFEPFKVAYNHDFEKHGANSAFLIHFRFATHGATNISNVHPFKVNENLVFGHNGVIDIEEDFKLSDTQQFNRLVLQKLQSDFLKNAGIRKLLSQSIDHSKLAFLDSSGKISIINEQLGHWNKHRGVWFSNDGYKAKQNNTCYVGGWNSYTNQYSRPEPVKFKLPEQSEAQQHTCEWCTHVFKSAEPVQVFGQTVCDSCELTLAPYHNRTK